MGTPARTLGGVLVALHLAAAGGVAQSPRRDGAASLGAPPSFAAPPYVAPAPFQLPGASPPSLTLRSLVVPGWGQWAQGQRRAVGYAVAEAALWALWAERRHRGGGLRDDYRDLAWSAARLPADSRRDGSWGYYETLSRWARSGSFDAAPAQPGIQPEEDPTTFNGSVWSLARGIHLGGGGGSPDDPRYQAALAWYQYRAYGDDFLWDWTGKEGDLQAFRDLIADSDHRFRQATTALGGVLANHLLSAADAYLSSRLSDPPQARLVTLPAAGSEPALHLLISWRHPR